MEESNNGKPQINYRHSYRRYSVYIKWARMAGVKSFNRTLSWKIENNNNKMLVQKKHYNKDNVDYLIFSVWIIGTKSILTSYNTGK